MTAPVDYAELENRWHKWRAEAYAIENEKRRLLAPLADRICEHVVTNYELRAAAPVDGFCPYCGVQRFTGHPHACGEG